MGILINEVCEPDDFQKIAALAKAIWTEHYTPIVGAAQVTYMLDKFQSAEVMRRQCQNEGYHYYEALYNGNLAGYCAIRPEEDAVFLSKIYVDKAHRGLGIAKAFLSHFTGQFQPRSVWLTVNKNNADSIAAYQKMGFEITEEIVADIGGGFVMDDYKMTLTA